MCGRSPNLEGCTNVRGKNLRPVCTKIGVYKVLIGKTSDVSQGSPRFPRFQPESVASILDEPGRPLRCLQSQVEPKPRKIVLSPALNFLGSPLPEVRGPSSHMAPSIPEPHPLQHSVVILVQEFQSASPCPFHPMTSLISRPARFLSGTVFDRFPANILRLREVVRARLASG